MKKAIIIFLVLFTAIISNAQFTKASLQASGLTCAMCNNAINKALKGLPFISSVHSNIQDASFDIAFASNASVDIDAMRKAVEDAGFFVAKLKMTGKFENVNVKNDEHISIGGKTFHFLDISDQVLNGEKTLTILDKNFLTAKEFRRMSTATKMACLQTGTMSVPKDGSSTLTRIYHVTI